MRTPRTLALFVMVPMVWLSFGVDAAENDDIENPKPLEERNLWRFEWDNDAFSHTGNAFTNGWSESWSAFDNQRFNAFQIYVGVLGPYSLAEQFQTQVHKWVDSEKPLGWDNQLKTEPLLNLNYNYYQEPPFESANPITDLT